MFSKEESKQLRQEFWTSFGKSYPRRWILYHTKIKGLSFKFHFDTSSALVAMDLEGSLDHRAPYWERLMSLKPILLKEYLPEAIFDAFYVQEHQKERSRIYVPLRKKVSIHDKQTWRDVMSFFYDTMHLFEAFFKDYKDLIEG